MESIYRSLNLARDKTLEEFLTSHPEPVFLVQPYQETELSFTTVAGSSRPWKGGDPRLVRVKKRQGASGFGAMITIGRASNNDIFFEGPGVSKFHAFLRKSSDGTFRVFDAGSTYGTYVGDRQIKGAADSATLASGDTLKLGQIDLLYFDGPGLYEYLRSFIPKKKDED